MKHKTTKEIVSAVDLRDCYLEEGEFSIKFLLGSRMAQGQVRVRMTDPDGKEMDTQVSRWGTKVHVSFKIHGDVPDGIVLIKFEGEKSLKKTFSTWILK